MNAEIEEIVGDLPALLTPNDLLKLGLFPSRDALHAARKRGFAPPELRLGRRMIRFPRNELIQWLSAKLLERKDAQTKKIST